MEAIIKGLVESAPHLAALVFIVVLFMRNIEKRDVLIRDLHNEHIDERRGTREVMKEAAESRDNNTDAMNRLVHAIERNQK